MDKRTNNSYHDNTTNKKKILTKMLFKIPKEIFPTEKYSFSIVTFFFCRSKEAYRSLNFRIRHFYWRARLSRVMT